MQPDDTVTSQAQVSVHFVRKLVQGWLDDKQMKEDKYGSSASKSNTNVPTIQTLYKGKVANPRKQEKPPIQQSSKIESQILPKAAKKRKLQEQELIQQHNASRTVESQVQDTETKQASSSSVSKPKRLDPMAAYLNRSKGSKGKRKKPI